MPVLFIVRHATDERHQLWSEYFMRRRSFFKKIGKGVTGIAAAASLPAVFAAERAGQGRTKGRVEIKIHPLAVSRKPGKK